MYQDHEIQYAIKLSKIQRSAPEQRIADALTAISMMMFNQQEIGSKPFIVQVGADAEE